MTVTAPNPGQFYLYDYVEPPLLEGSYRLTIDQQVTGAGQATPIGQEQRYFDIEGPRLTIPATDVAGVFPPRNGHGAFDFSLPHIAFFSKTLPWERAIDGTQPSGGAPIPWMALLLLHDDEYTLERQVEATTALPSGIPDIVVGDVCDVIHVDKDKLAAIMPTAQELAMLAHVRQVNVDDRELGAGSSDGWFAIVVSSRMPKPGAKHRACLVSLQGRRSLIPGAGQPAVPSSQTTTPPVLDFPHRLDGLHYVPVGTQHIVQQQVRAIAPRARAIGGGVGRGGDTTPPKPRETLVLLHSWEFTCEGSGTFETLMERLDDAPFGQPSDGKPYVFDSGHLAIDLTDRAGEDQQALYRGPLVPFPLTRDPLGPYHSADQCRRVVLEAGIEDISYAAAFEAGRLLATSDTRLAQELMRWRREAYRRAARLDLVAAMPPAWMAPNITGVNDPSMLPMAAIAAVSAVRSVRTFNGPLGDPLGASLLAGTPGADPQKLSAAWGLPASQAQAILGPDASSSPLKQPGIGSTITDLNQLASDAQLNQALVDARLGIESAAIADVGAAPGHP
jgi:hypothetical protein